MEGRGHEATQKNTWRYCCNVVDQWNWKPTEHVMEKFKLDLEIPSEIGNFKSSYFNYTNEKYMQTKWFMVHTTVLDLLLKIVNFSPMDVLIWRQILTSWYGYWMKGVLHCWWWLSDKDDSWHDCRLPWPLEETTEEIYAKPVVMRTVEFWRS